MTSERPKYIMRNKMLIQPDSLSVGQAVYVLKDPNNPGGSYRPAIVEAPDLMAGYFWITVDNKPRLEHLSDIRLIVRRQYVGKTEYVEKTGDIGARASGKSGS